MGSQEDLKKKLCIPVHWSWNCKGSIKSVNQCLIEIGEPPVKMVTDKVLDKLRGVLCRE